LEVAAENLRQEKPAGYEQSGLVWLRVATGMRINWIDISRFARKS
jgi:hypothetical protein